MYTHRCVILNNDNNNILLAVERMYMVYGLDKFRLIYFFYFIIFRL